MNELGRRLSAAYISYIAGYKGIDRVLQQTPPSVGEFWHDVARLLFEKAIQEKRLKDELQFREVITEYKQ